MITDEVLAMIAEADIFINFRPLTYVGLEPGNGENVVLNNIVSCVSVISEEHSVPSTGGMSGLSDWQSSCGHGGCSNIYHQSADDLVFQVTTTKVWRPGVHIR